MSQNWREPQAFEIPEQMPEREVQDIRGITPPDAFTVSEKRTEIPSIAIFFFISGILLILVTLFVTLRSRFAPPPMKPPHREQAFAAIARLETEAPHLPGNLFFNEVTRILRRYALDRYGDRVLFETTSEFAERKALEWRITEQQREHVIALLRWGEEFKFQAQPADADARRLFLKEALRILHNEPHDALPFT